ncbi:hypothetical protein [Lacinutrix chionoecetis]
MRIIALLIILVIFACKKEVSGGPNYELDIELLSNRIMKSGDENAYRNVSTFYFQTGDNHKLLPLAKIMSDKYNYTQAYFDVFYSIYSKELSYYNNAEYYLNHLSDLDKKQALNYLILAFEKGHSQAKYFLEDYYRDLYVTKLGNNYTIK